MKFKPSDALKVYRAECNRTNEILYGYYCKDSNGVDSILEIKSEQYENGRAKSETLRSITYKSLAIFTGKFDRNNVPIFASLVDTRGGDLLSYTEVDDAVGRHETKCENMEVTLSTSLDAYTMGGPDCSVWIEDIEVIGNQFQGDSE